MATKIVISESPPYFLDLDAPTLRAREAESRRHGRARSASLGALPRGTARSSLIA